MMKKIVLIRHAKSSWKDLSLEDFERPLNKRGKRDAPIMAQRLKEEGIAIEKIFSSSAKRAKKTALVFAEVLEKEVAFYDELYGSSVGALVDFINEQLHRYQNIAIVSHNPELTLLSNLLSEQYIVNIPTCGYVILECQEGLIGAKKCKYKAFVYPKQVQSSL